LTRAKGSATGEPGDNTLRSLSIVFPRGEIEPKEFAFVKANARPGHFFVQLGKDVWKWGKELRSAINAPDLPRGQSWPLHNVSDELADAIYQAFLWMSFLHDKDLEAAGIVGSACGERVRTQLGSEVADRLITARDDRTKWCRSLTSTAPSLNVMATASLADSVTGATPGTLMLFGDRIIRSALLEDLSDLVGSVFADLHEVEAGFQAKRAAADAEQAALLPKWAHGQRGTLFAVGSCLSDVEDCLVKDPHSVVNALKSVENARNYIEDGYQNVNLLQEMGHYLKNPNRWEIEVGRLSRQGNRVSTEEAVLNGIRTALVRALGINDGEADQRYRNAFQKLLMPRFLGVPQPLTDVERQLWPPSRIHAELLKQCDRDLAAFVKSVAGLPENWISLAEDYANFHFQPEARILLRELFLPPDETRFSDSGAPSENKQRTTAYVAAVRIVVEEVMLNYIKHRSNRDSIGKSLAIDATTCQYKGHVHRVKLLFLNTAADTQQHRTLRTAASESPLGSTPSGTLLCEYVLRGLGGHLRLFYSRQAEDDIEERTQLLTAWPSAAALGGILDSGPWFAAELDLPGCRLEKLKDSGF
jgi:hypothetical protein